MDIRNIALIAHVDPGQTKLVDRLLRQSGPLCAPGRHGWAVADLGQPRENLHALFDLIIAHVKPPVANPGAPFAMLVTTLESDPYVGRVLTGRIHAGTARVNMPLKAISRDGRVIEQGRLTKLLA